LAGPSARLSQGAFLALLTDLVWYVNPHCCLNFQICARKRKLQEQSLQEQHIDICSPLQGASISFHTILLGVGGTLYNNHTLESSKEQNFDCQILNEYASKLHVLSVKYAATFVHTRRTLSNIIINSHQVTVSSQACTQGVLQFPVLGKKG